MFGLALLSIVVEGVICYFKRLINFELSVWCIFSLVIGLALAGIFRIDLLYHAGIAANMPVLGYILTGILISRGSNYASDLIEMAAKKL